MTTVIERPSDSLSSEEEPRPARTALPVAAAASAAAGLVHAAAAGTHDGDRTLVALFAVVAVLQLGWAALALAVPTATARPVLVAGAALNGAFAFAWLASRTAGLPFIESLSKVEPVGWQDAAAASLGAVAAIVALTDSVVPAVSTRVMAVVTVALFGVATVGMVAGHSGGPSHEHEDGGDTSLVAGGSTGEAAHDHSSAAAAPPSPASADVQPPGHVHTPTPARLNHEPTEEQKANARELLEATKRETAKYNDVSVAVAAGYVSVGDSFTGVEHFTHPDYRRNVTILSPFEPESLVYRVLPDGGRQLITAMYILPTGATMDDVPDIAGNLTMWHDHQNLCWDVDTGRIVATVQNGTCPRGVFRPTPPMLHVWVVDNPCGPFAGTDTGQMTGSCRHDF